MFKQDELVTQFFCVIGSKYCIPKIGTIIFAHHCSLCPSHHILKFTWLSNGCFKDT